MRKQEETQKGFKLIKIRTETYKDLSEIIGRIEQKQPYLKGVVSFGVVLNMLMLKNKIKLSKNRYLIKTFNKIKGGLL